MIGKPAVDLSRIKRSFVILTPKEMGAAMTLLNPGKNGYNAVIITTVM